MAAETPTPLPLSPEAWAERVKQANGLKDDSWGEAQQNLRDDWLRAYVEEFVRFARSRNWSEQKAVDWAADLCNDAYTQAYVHDFDPVPAARQDVKFVEDEA